MSSFYTQRFTTQEPDFLLSLRAEYKSRFENAWNHLKESNVWKNDIINGLEINDLKFDIMREQHFEQVLDLVALCFSNEYKDNLFCTLFNITLSQRKIQYKELMKHCILSGRSIVILDKNNNICGSVSMNDCMDTALYKKVLSLNNIKWDPLDRNNANNINCKHEDEIFSKTKEKYCNYSKTLKKINDIMSNIDNVSSMYKYKDDIFQVYGKYSEGVKLVVRPDMQRRGLNLILEWLWIMLLGMIDVEYTYILTSAPTILKTNRSIPILRPLNKLFDKYSSFEFENGMNMNYHFNNYKKYFNKTDKEIEKIKKNDLIISVWECRFPRNKDMLWNLFEAIMPILIESMQIRKKERKRERKRVLQAKL